ncbi:general substrate transporter [Mycena rosella]|uniref:General substrate transporter n=1 Tax=Mycena rosella TaxID=1033263 RepID=A0AAD7D7A3_MYCRO|nr:general substrate transporter [Mycena rosella]
MHANPLPPTGANVVSELAAMDNRPWYKKPNLRSLYVVLLPACVGAEMTSAFDTNLMNGLQATSSWETCTLYHSPRPSLIGLMTAMYSLGAIFSLAIVPIIVDRRGRRASIFFGCTLMLIGAILQGASLNLHVFIAARFILGFGAPFSIVGSAFLIGELSHPKERAVMTCLFTGFFGVGSILIAGISLGTYSMQSDWGWRIPSVLQATPSIVQLAFVLFVPESPRWLVSKGRGTEAYAILVKCHAEGDAQSAFVKAQYVDIEKMLDEETRTGGRGWSELFSTPGMRKRAMLAVFLGISVQWSGAGLIGSYLPRILDSVGIHDDTTKNRINLVHSCWGLLCATTLALTMPRFKRRTVFLIGTTLTFLVMVGWTVATAEWTKSENPTSAVVVLVFIFLFTPACAMGFCTLVYAYLMELFPFRVRAKGLVLHTWFSRASVFLGQIINPIGLNNAGWKYYLSYCLFLLFQIGFVYFTFPETAHRTLEELAFIYEDGERAAGAISSEKACPDKPEVTEVVQVEILPY